MDKYYRWGKAMASELRSMLRWSMKAMCEPQDVMAIEVPGTYFTTQGVSPHRDVD
jgi:hypothetical protein